MSKDSLVDTSPLIFTISNCITGNLGFLWIQLVTKNLYLWMIAIGKEFFFKINEFKNASIKCLDCKLPFSRRC